MRRVLLLAFVLGCGGSGSGSALVSDDGGAAGAGGLVVAGRAPGAVADMDGGAPTGAAGSTGGSVDAPGGAAGSPGDAAATAGAGGTDAGAVPDAPPSADVVGLEVAVDRLLDVQPGGALGTICQRSTDCASGYCSGQEFNHDGGTAHHCCERRPGACELCGFSGNIISRPDGATCGTAAACEGSVAVNWACKAGVCAESRLDCSTAEARTACCAKVPCAGPLRCSKGTTAGCNVDVSPVEGVRCLP